MRVVTNSPLTFNDEINFSHIALLVEDETVSSVSLKVAWHEAKCDLVNKVRVEFCSDVEEACEAALNDNIFEEEMRHDELLDPMRNGIKVLALLEQHLTSILIPVPVEVKLNIPLQVRCYVEATTMRLVLDATDQIKPLLQLLLVQALILALN